MLKTKTVPDFSGWRFKLRRAIHFNLDELDERYFTRATPLASDAKSPHWLGYVSVYESRDGLAAGKEYEFFGGLPAIKMWGMRGSNRFEILAVWAIGRWEVFDSERHRLWIQAIPETKPPFRLTGAVVNVTVRDRDQQILKIKIDRN